MHNKPDVWNGLPKVDITADHIDRALKALGGDVLRPDQDFERFEAAILAAGVIAYMEAVDDKLQGWGLLLELTVAVVDEGYLCDWAIENYGLIAPEREESLRQGKENNAKAAERAEKARIKRASNIAAKRAAETEAEVQKRLANAA
ncbi:MAG: hypothetical protein FD175_236 [Beijerinckiaceae bacterium]|nr:MAG: hypothetical protein FD175_236 [Beijerinckiaceae bacterium]